MSAPVWQYCAIIGATNGSDREAVLDLGPYHTAVEAISAAVDVMGRTPQDVVRHWRISPPWFAHLSGDETDKWCCDGFTIERYDGEETDGSWSLNGGLRQHERADHTGSIEALRTEADRITGWGLHRAATYARAAAALLETHDATGINLATFGPVGEFVNNELRKQGLPPFEDNGV